MLLPLAFYTSVASYNDINYTIQMTFKLKSPKKQFKLLCHYILISVRYLIHFFKYSFQYYGFNTSFHKYMQQGQTVEKDTALKVPSPGLFRKSNIVLCKNHYSRLSIYTKGMRKITNKKEINKLTFEFFILSSE